MGTHAWNDHRAGHRADGGGRRRSLATLAALLLTAGLLTVGAPGAAQVPQEEQAAERAGTAVNGPIAFVANHDIWYRSAEGTFHQVTHGLTRPAWDLEMSPDGRRIAFSHSTAAGLWVVNLNGTHLRNVIGGIRALGGQGGYDPTWDPSGRRLAFVAYSAKTDNHELFTIEVDKPSSLRQLTRFGVGSEAVPSWNPTPGSNEIAYIPCCDGRIRTIDAVTGAERWVTADEDPPAVDLDWSPDGTRLAVETNTDGRLHVVNRDGTGWRYLDPSYSRGLHHPSWSPDGTTLAVEGLDRSGGSTSVLLVSPETGVPGGVTPVTGDWGDTEFAPTWGPACQTQCVGTELTAKATRRKSKWKVTGELVPGVAGATVKVTLQRAKGRSWKPVASKNPRTSAAGRYAATFARPRSGRCGVLVEFGGTATHMPSYWAVPPFRC